MADTCTISGTILNADGTPNTDVTILATVQSSLDDYGGQVEPTAVVGVTSVVIEAFTEDDGTFEITLIQGLRVLLEIQAMNLRKEILVPATPTADFISLI